MTKVKAAILRNESKDSSLRWERACERYQDQVLFKVIDLTANDWMEKIRMYAPDILLCVPGGLTSHFKQLYDERLVILSKELNFFCFPTLDEVLIYENKRYFNSWLKAHDLPHPKTHIFYTKDEAIDFIKKTAYPTVAKVNIGASGSGVTFLKDKHAARNYLENTFSGKGAKKRSGPNLQKKGLFIRGLYYIIHPGRIFQKLDIYRNNAMDIQKHFVIFQEYIPHEFEWRVVRIGNSFFAHKKLKSGEKASGSIIKGYENPPLYLLDFVKEVTDRFRFYSQAVDLFEMGNRLLINEMQCIFGQSDPYQMLVDGIPGRYYLKNKQWVFESGDFNTNESYDLRLQTALELYNKVNS